MDFNDIPSIISHLSVGTNDLERSVAFYDKVLPTVGARQIMHVPGQTAAYGKAFPEFWLSVPLNTNDASVGNGTHVAFLAASKDMVNEFFDTAVKAGATIDGKPGPRPEYGESYYGAFVRDPDGNKIEAQVILSE